MQPEASGNDFPQRSLVYALPDRVDLDERGQAVMRWGAPGAPFEASAAWSENPSLCVVRVIPGAFSSTACAAILELGRRTGGVPAGVEEGDQAYRESEVTWIQPSSESAAFYHRVALLFHQANQGYRFALAGLAEPLQIARYRLGGHFDWHIDTGLRETAGRKLSMTVQLSEEASYEGGDIEFINIQGKEPQRQIGTAIIFPAFLAHRVTAVTRGERTSIVAWAYGPSFA